MTSILEILEITEEDLSLKENRKKTLEYWPIDFIDKESIAESGFYFDGLGSYDSVRCFSCQISLNNWEEGDVPFTEHKKWSEDCEYLVEHFNIPKHPRYQLTGNRLLSFEDWPISIPVKPEDLSDAGFYYSGVGDKCICYHCAIVLKNWEVDDDAWEEHIRWRPNCKHIELMKGIEFINLVQTKLENKNSIKVKEEEEILENCNNTDDRYTCGICFDNQREIALIPCGHTFCAKCSMNITKCATCRKDIVSKLRLYF